MFYDHSIAYQQQRIWKWVPLFYSVFYFLPMIMNWDYFSTLDIALSLVAYAAFVGLYLWANHQQGSRVLIIMLLMLLLCCVATLVTPGTQALFGFVAFLAGFHLLGVNAFLMFALILACITFCGFFFAAGPVGYFLLPAWVVTVGIFFFGMYERRERQHAREKAKTSEQIKHLGAVAERERIARDLHDLLGHSLSSIALKAELAEKLLAAENAKQAEQEITQVSRLARELLSEVRQAVAGMKKMGLPGQLNEIQENLKSRAIRCHFQQPPQVNSQIESAMCFICTEAATNIIRHAKNATLMRIEFDQTSEYHLLRIQDDGDEQTIKWGNGLKGINERCEQLGGYLEVQQEQETTLTCYFAKASA